jgi:hypothetical protein
MNKTLKDYIPELNSEGFDDSNIDIIFDSNEPIELCDINNSNNLEKIKEEVKKDINPLDTKKKYIIDTIKKFTKFEQIEIFKILKKNNVKYSENNNGVFINLNILSESILDEIELFINFCITKKNCLQAEKNKREKIAKLIKEEDKNFKNNVINNPIETESKLNIQKGIEYVEINNEEDKNEMYYKESNFVLPTIEQNI